MSQGLIWRIFSQRFFVFWVFVTNAAFSGRGKGNEGDWSRRKKKQE